MSHVRVAASDGSAVHSISAGKNAYPGGDGIEYRWRPEASAIEATAYPDLVRQYQVTGVPKTVVDGQIEILGAQPEEIFVREVLRVCE